MSECQGASCATFRGSVQAGGAVDLPLVPVYPRLLHGVNPKNTAGGDSGSVKSCALDEASLLEGGIGAALLHRLERLGRDGEGDLLAQFGDEEGLLLEVYLAAALAGRVELGSADAVGVPASDQRFLTCDDADSCHMGTHGIISLLFMQPFDTVFIIATLIFSAIVHEVMHGVAAEWLGDKTARYAGRITLNPIPHLDLVGSIFLPVLLVLTHSPLFIAWAKPVPYNPYNLRSDGLFRRFGEAIVAGAGPLSNLVIAAIFGLVIRAGVVAPDVAEVLYIVVLVNVALLVFNLIPLPPLDGSKVIEALLPRPLAHGYGRVRHVLEMNPFGGMFLILVFIMLFGHAYGAFVYTIASAVAGV